MDLLNLSRQTNPIGISYTDGEQQGRDLLKDRPTNMMESLAGDYMSRETGVGYELNPLGDSDKYTSIGLSENVQLLKEQEKGKLDKVLSDNQTWTNQLRNSLVQTASELTLGTVKSFADLFDMVIYNRLRSEIDYQNPVSAMLEGWQESIRENMPVYADPEKSILNGGLFDSGFIFQGLPSIVSSLTLMVPSKAVTVGGAKLINYFGNKGVKWLRQAEKANRAITEGEKLSKAAKLDMFLNDANAYRRTKEFAEFGIGGLTSRLLENYQEARQTYNDSKGVYRQIWSDMTPAQREAAIERLKQENGEDAIDWNNEEAIIDLVSRNAADKTFTDDLWNTGFDIYQMYTLAKPFRAINGPSRAALRRYQKTQLANMGKTDKEIQEILNKRSRWQKFKDGASDLAFGAKHTMLAELSEGAEEAINYISQEEGMTYGKMLLGKYEGGDFGQRLQDYLVAPKLWDSAFWGFVGGIVFGVGGEQINRLTDARRIQQSAEKLKEAKPELGIKVPTFWEAYRQTENDTRMKDLQERNNKYNNIIRELKEIEDGKDIDGITQNGKLESKNEIDAARNYHFQKFVDDVLLDAMDSGNYDMAIEFLNSDELANAFVEGGHMSKDEMDNLRTNIKNRGGSLIEKYNKHLRIARNAAESLGQNNKAELYKMPAEFFNIVARENLSHELTAEYFQSQIDAINNSDVTLENDVKAKLDEAGVDFKSMINTIMTAHQLGMIDADIAEIENGPRKSTLNGQNDLRLLKLQKKVLEKGLTDERTINNMKESDVDRLSRIFVGLQSAASVEVIPGTGTEKNPRAYQSNTGTIGYLKFKDAIESRDLKLIKALNPVIADILNDVQIEGSLYTENGHRKTKEEAELSVLERAINKSNVINQQIENIYKDKATNEVTSEAKLLKNISEQLATNYANLSTYSHLKNFELARIMVTKDEVLERVHQIANFLNEDRKESIEEGNALLHHLAKKYGKDNIINEVNNYITNNTHSDNFSSWQQDEKDAFDYYVKLMNLMKPQNDLLLGDLRKSLQENETHDFTIDKPIVEKILEARRKAAQKSTASEKPNTEGQDLASTNISGDTIQDGSTPVEEDLEGSEDTEDSETPPPSDDDVVTEGVITITPPPVEDDTNTDDNNPENAATDSSTGGQNDFNEDDLIFDIADAIKELAQNKNTSVDDTANLAIVKQLFKEDHSELSDEMVDVLFAEARMLAVAESQAQEVETELVDGVVRLSAISVGNPTDLASQRARQILNSSFEELLKNFNTYLGRSDINGKQVIYFEQLLRYAKAITNNKYSAEEVFEAFNRIIQANPDKYVVVYNENQTTEQIIQNVAKPLSVRRANLNDSIGGKNFNFASVLATLEKEERKKVEKLLEDCKVGDKVICKVNYDNSKLKEDGTRYPGGIDFYFIDSEGKEILVAKAPAPAPSAGGSYIKGIGHWMEMENGWFHQFDYDVTNAKEYELEKFFKDLLTSDNAHAVAFRKGLAEYEALKHDEWKIREPEFVKRCYPELEAFAREMGYNIDIPTPSGKQKAYLYQRGTANSYEMKARRFRHISALDVFVMDEQSLVLESLGFVKRSKEDIKKSKRDSIHQWFMKMTESSNARQAIIDDAENSSTKTSTITIATKNEPTLRIIDKKDALPVSQAVAEQHRPTIKIATGTPGDTSTVIASGQAEPFSIVGQNTKNRTVVLIDKPQGGQTYINAYPVKMNSKNISSNHKMHAFKIALETKLKELLDEWKISNDSTELQAFIHELVGVDSDSTSLFRGFRPEPIPNTPNGFRIPFKVKDGEIVPLTETGGDIHYLNFFDSLPTTSGRIARAAVQEFVPGQDNSKATVWSSKLSDTSNTENVIAQRNLEKRIMDVVINSLMIKISPLYILADNNPSTTHTGIATRDKDNNFILKIKLNNKNNAPKELKDYMDDKGNVVFDEFGSFGDFILNNDLVNLTTRHFGTSNFEFINNGKGQLGITYTLDETVENSSVEEVITVPPTPKPQPVTENLRLKVENIFDKASKARRKTNVSRQILLSIVNQLGESSSLYKMFYGDDKTNKKPTLPKILDSLLHSNVRQVHGLNGATLTYSDGTTTIIPGDASAMYVPVDCTVTVADSNNIFGSTTIQLKKGDIVVGDIFMNWLNGSNLELYDAIRALIHENLHASMDEKKIDSPYNNDYLFKGLEEVYNELRSKKPDSAFVTVDLSTLSDNAKKNQLEEFLVESLTNINLIKELNDTEGKDVNLPVKKKSLLAKLLDKVLNWLSDFLGPNFKVDKDSLLAKEYELFESVFINNNKSSSETSNDNQNENDNIGENGNDSQDSSTGGIAKPTDSESLPIDNNAINNATLDAGEVPFFSRLPVSNDTTISSEMQDIKEKAIADGTFMKAPNGKPTNLNERQWLQVRTKSFKEWFGDWENDPNNASKVVDENGEPLVVYHITKSDNGNTPYTEFNMYNKYDIKVGSFFTSDKNYAISLGKFKRIENPYIFESFLNIRNPYGLIEGLDSDKSELILNSTNNDGIVGHDLYTEEHYFHGLSQSKGTEYVVSNSNQVKSATDNNGEFSTTNNNIRFSTIAVSETNPIITTPSIRSIMSNLDDETYSDIQKKLNNGILSITCH